MARWRDDDAEALDPRDAPPPTLRRAVRIGLVGYAEEALLFLALNFVLLLTAIALAVAWTFVPALVVVAPLLALPAAVLMRLAVAVARDEAASWALARDELLRRAARKVAVATVQLLLTALAALNVLLAPSFGGLLGAVVAAAAAYGGIMVTAYAIALWPLVCDPRRDGSLASQLRLAAAIVLLRPLQVAALLAMIVASVALSLMFVAPAVLLPSVMALIVAAYVVPVADVMSPPAVERRSG